MSHTQSLSVQHEPHQIDGRNVEVKAAIPKSRGGGQKSTNKLFVGGVPVRFPLLPSLPWSGAVGGA